MKAPKSRPLNDYLRNNIKRQEHRIKECGIYANVCMWLTREKGTYFSTKFKKR